MKKFKKTKAKLPADEENIGGDAPKGSGNKVRKQHMKDLIIEANKKKK